MIQGKCLCGEISYTLDGELLYLYNCHCVQCRAASGSSFATNASIMGKDFHINDPGKLLSSYQTAAGSRHFCSACGSPIYCSTSDNDEFPTLQCGTITGFPDKALDANIWVSEKCSWSTIDDAIKQFDKHPQ